MHKVTRVVNSGETGAEIGALAGAQRAGVSTGGNATKDFNTEAGAQQAILQRRFNLNGAPTAVMRECQKININYSDATIIFTADPEHEYIQQIVALCEKADRVYCMIDITKKDVSKLLNNFISITKPLVVNVTGDKKSTTPNIATIVASVIQNLNKEGS